VLKVVAVVTLENKLRTTEINKEIESATGVNFINILRTNFSYKHHFFYVRVTRENNVSTKKSYV